MLMIKNLEYYRKSPKVLHLHFVGIGGVGMSGIAEVFWNQGYHVSGSDVHASDYTHRLASLGVSITMGHDADHIQSPDVVVYSSAVHPENPELLRAKALNIPIISRAEMLGELMRGKIGIGVAGSHGKTTTTTMLSCILSHADLDPTFVIGGKVDAWGTGAKVGQSEFVVAEADESDGSFLYLPLTYAVITNIDTDHLDYFKTFENLQQAFVEFVKRLPFYGKAFICKHDKGVEHIIGLLSKPFTTYGWGEDCDWQARKLQTTAYGLTFDVISPQGPLGLIELPIPGEHNVLNALAAIAVATELGVSFEKIFLALKHFGGVKRRFEIKWASHHRQQMVVDDYGHHPTEIFATLQSARQVWSSRIVVIFQPHRYTRSELCWESFMTCFKEADIVLMMDIYSAGETPIEGIHSEALTKALQTCNPQKHIVYTAEADNTLLTLSALFTEGDLILFLGAGSVSVLVETFVNVLRSSQVMQPFNLVP